MVAKNQKISMKFKLVSDFILDIHKCVYVLVKMKS